MPYVGKGQLQQRRHKEVVLPCTFISEAGQSKRNQSGKLIGWPLTVMYCFLFLFDNCIE